MEIKATIIYDEQIFRDFIAFSIFKGKRFKTRRIAFAIIIPLLIAALVFDLSLSLLWLVNLMLVFLIYYGSRPFWRCQPRCDDPAKNCLGQSFAIFYRECPVHP